jgi:S-adenosylmethionine:tRNA ribosyltransferase-isomerase
MPQTPAVPGHGHRFIFAPCPATFALVTMTIIYLKIVSLIIHFPGAMHQSCWSTPITISPKDNYHNIADHIPPDTTLVFNNTRVVPARIIFQKESGATIEIFCLNPADEYSNTHNAMLQIQRVQWQCMIGGASKWKPGQVLEKIITVNDNRYTLYAEYVSKQSDHFIINFHWEPITLSFSEILHLAGAIPLPPYIKRAPDKDDIERYQTVYAAEEGSVAAPTAGLHFTKKIFDSLIAKNIKQSFVTLHVGAGTFRPVKSATMNDHEMHAEFIEVDRALIQQLLNANGKIVAVGTTSLRTLESLYWLGSKLIDNKITTDIPAISQWEIYEDLRSDISTADALRAILKWMTEKNTDRLFAKTQVLIAPGYKFKIVDGLITNFHQPHSTLLLLVAAFIGEDWKIVYDYALANDFRFLSYGDGSLLWRS